MENKEENKFIELLYKKLSQRASMDDLKQLEDLQKNNEAFRHLYIFLSEQEQNGFEKENETKEAELAYAALFAKMHANGNFDNENVKPLTNTDKNNTGKYFKIFVSSAAAVLLVCFLIYSLIDKTSSNNWKNSNVVATKKGSKSFVLLPDGTKVWLNVDSKLTYKEKFNESTRQVKLTGEAFFDVAKDAKHPFIIHTNDADIKVLGTAFNVKAYESDSNMETLLVRGKIEVTFNKMEKSKVILHPGERLKILHKISHKNNSTIIQDGVNDSIIVERFNLKQKDIQDTLWLKNTISFDSEPLVAVAKKLEKWFDVTVLIKNEKLNNLKFTGKFENQSLDFILSTLKETGKLDYELHQDTVYLYK